MLQSMTGFGKAVRELPNKRVSVEVKSLNSKQLDINARIPGAYREKDMEMRAILSQAIGRGKVDFYLLVEHPDAAGLLQLNRSAIRSYHAQICETAKNLQIDVPSDWFSILLRLPETVKTEMSELDEEEWRLVQQTLSEALDAFQRFRMQEGRMLESVFVQKIAKIQQLLAEIDNYESERIESIRLRIADSFKKWEMPNYDENRFEQELIFYIEKLDVNEEKSRLQNHLNYFLETIEKETGQGRKLGFIAQEMGREINTLGSKANHQEMQKIVVQMKDELEQIKEQILNVL
ncbi:MAG: YicC family protein [Dysgonamonadaceae bacterium]|jgi:uncharacterized protein (TIGR00255 family)|nr:YicC family protein [Dysgonamonadaceae bacterium]